MGLGWVWWGIRWTGHGHLEAIDRKEKKWLTLWMVSWIPGWKGADVEMGREWMPRARMNERYINMGKRVDEGCDQGSFILASLGSRAVTGFSITLVFTH